MRAFFEQLCGRVSRLRLLGDGSGASGGGNAFMPSAFAEPRETVNNYFVNSTDPAGQHAEDVLQDMDQDQDDAQDASYDDGGSSDFSSDT